MPFSEIAAREHGRRVEVREHRRRRRVGEVVGGDVDRLHRGDRALARRGDALLQLAHLGLQRRLVADLRRHAAEQRRDLRARLDEAEDVVDEQQHVLALLAEVLGHRQARQRDAHARAGRLVHLAEDEHRLVDDARLLHLEPEVVALARALADAAEGRQAAVLLGEVVDQLLDQHRLADAGAAEQADLAALGVGREQVDDLDAGLEHLGRRRQVLDRRRRAVDRPALASTSTSAPWSIGSPSRLKMRPSVSSPTGTVIGPPVSMTSAPRARPSVVSIATARTRSSPRCCCTSQTSVVPVLARGSTVIACVDLGKLVREDGLDDDALDLLDPADVRCCARLLSWRGGPSEFSFVLPSLASRRPTDDVT